MTRPAQIPLLALLLAACARSASASDRAVDACIAAVEAASTSDAGSGDRAVAVTAGCASLYAEAECREVHLHLGEIDPSQKARALAERCAHAYCDKLDGPKPALCSGVPAASPSELAPAWAELRQRIWLRDLGDRAAARLNEAMARASERPPAPTAEPLGPPRIVVRDGKVSLDGIDVATIAGVAPNGRVQRIDGLYEALKRRRRDHLPSERTVVFDIAADVPAVVVKSVAQTSAFAGYTDLRFAGVDGGPGMP